MSALDHAVESLVAEITERVLARVAERIATAPTPEWVTVADLARAWSVSAKYIRARVADGSLPAMHVGRSVRVRRDAVLGKPVQPAARADSPSERVERALRRRAGGRP